MYGKLFASMYEGTLYGQWQAIVTLQQMVIVADEDGTVDMTPPHLAAKTSIPLEIIEKGLEYLSQPDKYSRSEAEEGRRIVLIDESRPWGWRIVNYLHYRNVASREDKKRKDRERIAEKRSKNNDVATCRNESQQVADVAHTDTDTYTDTKTSKNPCALSRTTERFDEFWQVYPVKRDKKKARDKWKAKGLDSKADQIISDVQTRATADGQWLEGYIPLPTTYLNGERWEDEISAPKTKKANGSEWNKVLSASGKSTEDRRRFFEDNPHLQDAINAAGGLKQIGLLNEWQLKTAKEKFEEAK